MNLIADTIDDSKYWDNYYRGHNRNYQSNFAAFCLPLLVDGNVFEAGFGDGIDSIFFARNRRNVFGVDYSEEGLKIAKTNADVWGVSSMFTGMVADFTSLATVVHPYSNVYSRFTLHSVDEVSGCRFLKWSFDSLRSSGRLFIECRSVNDDKFGMGEKVGHNTFVLDGHTRRFINLDELKNYLVSLGFRIYTGFEGRGLSPHKDEDPVLIRIVACKD